MTPAAACTLACPACGFILVSEPNQNSITCRRCDSNITVDLFPAFYRKEEHARRQDVMADEASCFFHAERVAAFACSRCGRFLCALCRIEWPGEDLCPACLEAANSGQRAKQFASSRFHYDSLALALSVLQVLGGFASILTAPISLGFAIFTFNRECSVVPRSKIRFVLAIFFSLAILVGWIALFVEGYAQRYFLHNSL